MSECSLLVVDADPAVHQLLAETLRRGVQSVQNCYDGKEALSSLRSRPFDVVVAGKGRNGLEGAQLLRRMRALRPEVKVILTGEPDPAHALEAIRARAFSYFHKPLQSAPLAEMIHQALQASEWEDDVKVISARPEWIGLELRCKFEAAERAVHLLGELEPDLPRDTWEDVGSAFRELLLNAIEHGGKSDARKRVQVQVLRTTRSLLVNLRDPGKGFSREALEHCALGNPEDAPTRHVELRAEQGRRPGGFGILMARNLVDELLYNERGNEVMFVKRLTRNR